MIAAAESDFAIYVHWPYCAVICPYCDFNVYRKRDIDPAPLIAAIKHDIAAHRAELGARTPRSVFLGGGTPSLLSGAALSQILTALDQSFPFPADIEISLEANPEDATRYADHVAAGVNRLSLGVQALADRDLAALGRRHDAASALGAIEKAHRTGARVSMDLIYARQDQSAADWQNELAQALALPIEHLSLYQLTIEAGTAFERAVRRGRLTPPGDSAAAGLYELTQAHCSDAGFPAYEVSNHARTAAARSMHNLIYWRSGEWIGVGPGAHGRIVRNGQRWATSAHRHPKAYCEAVAAKGVGWENASMLSAREAGEEALMMGLRLIDGVAPAPIEALLGQRLDTQALESEGLIERSATRISVTPRGRLLTDRIATDLLA